MQAVNGPRSPEARFFRARTLHLEPPPPPAAIREIGLTNADALVRAGAPLPACRHRCLSRARGCEASPRASSSGTGTKEGREEGRSEKAGAPRHRLRAHEIAAR